MTFNILCQIRILESLTIIFHYLNVRFGWKLILQRFFSSFQTLNWFFLNISFLALLDFANFKTLYGREFWVDWLEIWTKMFGRVSRMGRYQKKNRFFLRLILWFRRLHHIFYDVSDDVSLIKFRAPHVSALPRVMDQMHSSDDSEDDENSIAPRNNQRAALICALFFCS